RIQLSVASTFSLSPHDALPICRLSSPVAQREALHRRRAFHEGSPPAHGAAGGEPRLAQAGDEPYAGTRPVPQHAAAARSQAGSRSEEHTSELQSREKLVCRLLL